MSNIIETRIPNYRFAAMDEEQEQQLKDISKRFAKDMRYDFNFEYYSIYWTEENYLLAKLAMPELESIVTKVP